MALQTLPLTAAKLSSLKNSCMVTTRQDFPISDMDTRSPSRHSRMFRLSLRHGRLQDTSLNEIKTTRDAIKINWAGVGPFKHFVQIRVYLALRRRYVERGTGRYFDGQRSVFTARFSLPGGTASGSVFQVPDHSLSTIFYACNAFLI